MSHTIRLANRMLAGLLAFLLVAGQLAWPTPVSAMRQLTTEGTGLEELKAALRPGPSVGLEEFHHQAVLQPGEIAQLQKQLGDLVGLSRARCYAALIRSLKAGQGSQDPLPPAAYGLLSLADIRRNHVTSEAIQQGLRQLRRTAVIIQAGGGGTRFDNSLPEGFRQRWGPEGEGTLSKPTAGIGTLRQPTIERILRVLNQLAHEAGDPALPVFTNVTHDTKAQMVKVLARGSSGGALDALGLYLTDQLEHPVYDENGLFMWTVDGNGVPRLVTAGIGTLGGVASMTGSAQDRAGQLLTQTPLKLSQDRDRFLILYADDPVLNDRDFILSLLAASVDVDIMPIGVARWAIRDAAGNVVRDHGDRVQFGPPGGRIVMADQRPVIIELADSNPARPVKHRHLNDAESALFTHAGRGFTFNVGTLVLSRRALEAAIEKYQQDQFPPHPTERKIVRVNQRPLAQVPLVELFLTDLTELVGGQVEMVTQVAELELERYEGTKDFGRLIEAEAKIFQAGQQRLATLRGEVDPEARVEFSPEWDDPRFPGLLGTNIQVRGLVTVAFEANRIVVRKLVRRTDEIHMVATDDEIEKDQLLLAAQAGQRVGEKGAFQQRVDRLLSSLKQAQAAAQSLLVGFQSGSVGGKASKAIIQVTMLEPTDPPVVLFEAKPGQHLVVPPETVIDVSVFKEPERVSTVGQAASSLAGITEGLVRRQQAAGVVPSLADAPAPRTYEGSPYVFLFRPTVAAKLASPVQAGRRACPLCLVQWSPQEQGYLWRQYLLKANINPRQEGDVVLSLFQHEPQGLTPRMLRDLVAYIGGSEDDPAIDEAVWLIQELQARMARGEPMFRGLNILVVGPGEYRGFYNDAGVGASIPEHGHMQASPHPQPIETMPIESLGSVGLVTHGLVAGWDGPVFAVRSEGLTIYVASKARHNPAPIAPDPQAYLAMDRTGQDASGLFLIAPAAREMMGTMITSDESTYARATPSDFRQIVVGAMSPREAIEPIAQAMKARGTSATVGLEEVSIEQVQRALRELTSLPIESGRAQAVADLRRWLRPDPPLAVVEFAAAIVKHLLEILGWEDSFFVKEASEILESLVSIAAFDRAFIANARELIMAHTVGDAETAWLAHRLLAHAMARATTNGDRQFLTDMEAEVPSLISYATRVNWAVERAGRNYSLEGYEPAVYESVGREIHREVTPALLETIALLRREPRLGAAFQAHGFDPSLVGKVEVLEAAGRWRQQEWARILESGYRVPRAVAELVSMMHRILAFKALSGTEQQAVLVGEDDARFTHLLKADYGSVREIFKALVDAFYAGQNIDGLWAAYWGYTPILEAIRLWREAPEWRAVPFETLVARLRSLNRHESLVGDRVVSDAELADLVPLLIAEQRLLGIMKDPPGPEFRKELGGGLQAQLNVRRQGTLVPPKGVGDYHSRLSEPLLRRQGEAGLGWGRYQIHGNVFPLLEDHLVIVNNAGVGTRGTAAGEAAVYPGQFFDESVARDMLDLVGALPGYRIFYNHAKLVGSDATDPSHYIHWGASVPHHHHLQGVRYPLPIETYPLDVRFVKGPTTVGVVEGYPAKVLVLQGTDRDALAKEMAWVARQLDPMPRGFDVGQDVGFNVMTMKTDDEFRVYIFPRSRYLSSHVYQQEQAALKAFGVSWPKPSVPREGYLAVNPAAVEMAGYLATTDPVTYEQLDEGVAKGVLSEVSVPEGRFAVLLGAIRRRVGQAGLEQSGITRQPPRPLVPIDEAVRQRATAAGMEERPERLGFHTWAATLGAWGPIREVLRQFDKPTREMLISQINSMVKRLNGRGIDPKPALLYGISVVVDSSPALVDFERNLRVFENLVTKMGARFRAAPQLSWVHVTQGVFARLFNKAATLRAGGLDYRVEGEPERSFPEMEERHEPGGPAGGPFITEVWTGRYIVESPQVLRLVPTGPMLSEEVVPAGQPDLSEEELRRLVQPTPPEEQEPPATGLEEPATLTRAVSPVTVRVYDGLVDRATGAEAPEAIRPLLNPTSTVLAVPVSETVTTAGVLYAHPGIAVPAAMEAWVIRLPETTAGTLEMLQEALPGSAVLLDVGVLTDAVMTPAVRAGLDELASARVLRVLRLPAQDTQRLREPEWAALLAAAPVGRLLDVARVLVVGLEERQLLVYL